MHATHRATTTLVLAVFLASTAPHAALAQVITQHEVGILRAPVADRQDGDRFGHAIAMDEDYLVVGAPGDDERGVDAGAAYVFARQGLTWVLQAKLAPAALQPGDAFGTAVDVKQGHIVVGAPGDDRQLNEAGLQLGRFENRGAAYLFDSVAGAWTLARRYEPRAPDFYPYYGNVTPGAGDAFGSAVALLWNVYVAFGAPLTDAATPDVGAVYVCYIEGTACQQFVGPSESTPAAGGRAVGPGRLGASLTFGPQLRAGQPSDSSRGGGVLSFSWTGGTGGIPLHWEPSGYGSAPVGDVTSASTLGASISGRWISAPAATVPGDPTGPASGAAWILASLTTPFAIYPASGRDATMRFGTSIADAGSAVFVGSVHSGQTGPAVPVMRFDAQDDGSWVHAASLMPAGVTAGDAYGASVVSSGTYVFVGSPVSTDVPGGFVAVFLNDGDHDGLPDNWETRFALSPTSAAGPDGAAGDNDGDGVSNLDEYAAQTHPAANPAFTRYFAEGATTWQFGTWIFIANPGTNEAHTQLRFLLGDGSVRSHVLWVPPMSMQYVAVHDLIDMHDAEFATTIESDQPIVTDRAMWWPRGPGVNPYGSHAERAIVAPAPTWYFAEGATHSGFDLFYLLQNPDNAPVTVRARYLRPFDAPLEKLYTLPPLSRTTIWVNTEAFDTGGGPTALLASADVAAVFDVQASGNIIVERSLYRTGPAGRPFESGHESAGVTAPASDWFFAEGKTGDTFDTFFLIANPNEAPAQIRAEYLLDDGRTFTRDLTVAANARTNIWADVESFDDGATFPLADAAFSTRVTVLNGQPVIAERSMWWPGPSFTTWHEAHNSFGSTETGTKWVAAFGAEVPGNRTSSETATYFLIANPGATTAEVTVTPLLAGGPSTSPRTATIPPHSRATVSFGPFGVLPEQFFGAIVESIGSPAVPIVVERSVYRVAGALNWPVGSAALLTKVQ